MAGGWHLRSLLAVAGKNNTKTKTLLCVDTIPWPLMAVAVAVHGRPLSIIVSQTR